MSYASTDLCKENRLKNGWLSDYTEKEIEFIFEENGYIIVDTQVWREQKLYNLEKRYVK